MAGTHTRVGALLIVSECLKKHQCALRVSSGAEHLEWMRWERANPSTGAGWQPPGAAADQRAALASATVSAVMLMMRRTVADGVRMWTGWAAPSSTGPIAMPPPAATFSRL